MRHRVLVLALAVTLVTVGSARAAWELRACASMSAPDQVASPNWLVGFHELPDHVRPNASYLGARVHHVDDAIDWASVTAPAWWPCVARLDPRVEHVEPNRMMHLSEA